MTELNDVQGFNLSNNPFLKVGKEQLINFKHTENGIVFHTEKDIQALYILQKPNMKGKVSLIIPNGQVYSDLPFEVYGRDSFILIKAILPLYTYEAKLKVDGVDMHFSGTPKLKKYYPNKVQAKYWTYLLYSLCEGGEFTIYFEGNKEHKFTLPFIKEGVALYSEMLEYYEIVSKIEDIMNESFSQYECFTYENYVKAKKIASYLTRTAYIHNFDDQAKKLIFQTTQDPSETMNVDEKYVIFQSAPIQEPFVLNGKCFDVKYENSYLSSCSIVKSEKLNDTIYAVEVSIDENSIPIYYSDTPITQEDNKISLI